MNDEHSPLLSRGEELNNNESGDISANIRGQRGFSNTIRSTRSSMVQDSTGRQGIISYLGGFLQPGGEVFLDEEDGLKVDNIEILSTEQASRLAREERTLLRDNNIACGGGSFGSGEEDDEILADIIETNKAWDDAIGEGKVATTAWRELKVLSSNSLPLIVAFLLQCSLPVASIFSVGHLGKTELAAVSLGSMTANITGFSLIQGLATCLDTLCPQAFGAGNFNQVGTYFQKCAVLAIVCFIPVGALWICSDKVLPLIIDDPELVILAVNYLRVAVIGVPGYILFECGKRFFQAQGIFQAGTYILMICAPFNAIMNYLLVWSPTIGIGYLGAPIAMVLTNWLMPILQLLYLQFIDGKRCWGGFLHPRVLFRNWGPMFRLALPGVLMIEAEFLAFEILTLAASKIGTADLAAQSVLSSSASLTYQLPFAVAIATSTRTANFVGATLIEPAKLVAKVSIYSSFVIALLNTAILYFFRRAIGGLFSNDQEVIDLVDKVMPMAALLQVSDGPACICGGILRGQGRQYIGGYLNMIAYYIFSLPISLGLAFGTSLELNGLWIGITVGVFIVFSGEFYYILKTDWEHVVDEARIRNREERILSHE